MDNSGRWHASEEAAMKANEEIRRAFGDRKSDMPERPAISIEIGEMVSVRRADGVAVRATFDSAEKNKVTLTPQDDGSIPVYMELAQTVSLERATGENVKAQVWDNRKGKLILRTLPV